MNIQDIWKAYRRQLIPVIFFGFLCALIFYPLIRNGFLFLLDWQVPHISGNPGFFPPNFIRWFFSLGNVLSLPLWLTEKLFFICLFFMMGVGMYLLAPRSAPAKLFAGMLYMLNPFIYSRFLFGQMTIVAAYALLPLFLWSLVRFLEKKTWQYGALSIVCLAFIIGTSIHFVPFVVLILIGLLLGTSAVRFGMPTRGDERWKTKKKGKVLLAVSILFFLVITALGSRYWYPRIEVTVDRIGWNDFVEFKTNADSTKGVLSAALYTASLHGFWGEREGWYTLATEVVPVWWLWEVILLGIVGIGIGAFVRRCFVSMRASHSGNDDADRIIPAAVLLCLGALSYVLALGLATPLSESMTRWLYDHIPLYAGFRDTQKWHALLVLSLAYFGGGGIAYVHETLLKRRDKINVWIRSVTLVLLCTVPLVLMPLMFGGFAGQIQVSQIPPGWFTVRDMIRHDPEQSARTLFLPWHQYLPTHFTQDRVVQNPAPWFFGPHILSGDNVEKGSIYTKSTRPESKLVERYIVQDRPSSGRLSWALNRLGVTYVILALEHDHSAYWWLFSHADLKLLYRDENIALFTHRKPLEYH